MRASIQALIPAAGTGQRFGGGLPKQFLPVCGRPVLVWAVLRLLEAGVTGAVVALPKEFMDETADDLLEDPRVRWIVGGPTRQESVAACLEAAAGHPRDLVLVHDGARPAVAPSDVRATLEAAEEADGAILGRPLSDTLKRLDGEAINGTLDRRGLFRAETPQVFRREILERAVEQSREDGFQGTDEASLVERLPGVFLRAVQASCPNPKLTDPADLALIESLLGSAES